MAIFSNPVQAVFGIGCYSMFLQNIKNVDGNILLLTGNKSTERIEGEIINCLTGKSYVHISKIIPNPDISHIYENIRRIRATGNFKPDYIYAVGGGSVLDTAKSLKALLGVNIDSVEELTRIITNKAYLPIDSPLIFCPTAAGTGSEVTKWATVWDIGSTAKYSIEGENLYADKAFIDPELTCSMPLSQSISCAFDALSHAIESYWSPASCKISRQYSLNAIELFESIIDDFIDHDDLYKREVISLFSYFAGLAFSHTRTTVCHAISYPLTLIYGVPHGIAACMSIPHMLEINSGFIVDERKLLNALNVATGMELMQKTTLRLARAGILSKLSDYGFVKDDLKTVAGKCFTKGRVDNNPVKVSIEQIESILLNI